MSRFVICPDVAVRLAADDTQISSAHQLLAPTLLRSQLLSALYRAVRAGTMTKRDADRHPRFVRALRIRLLGDATLQGLAWRLADQLGWPDTLNAEYVALTRLHGDAFVTLDPELADAAKDVVTIAPVDALGR